MGEHEEHQRWIAEGHSQRCFTRTAVFEDTEVQTDPATVSTVTAISESPTSTYSASGTQTSYLHTFLHPTTNQSIQTNPISARTSCHTIKPPISSSKNPKIVSTSEIQPNIVIFSSPTPSVTSLSSTTPSTTTLASESWSITASFIENHQNIEISPISTQIISKTPTSSISEPADNIARVYASPHTQSDVMLQPQSAPATHSNASSSELPAATGHEKSTLASEITI